MSEHTFGTCATCAFCRSRDGISALEAIREAGQGSSEKLVDRLGLIGFFCKAAAPAIHPKTGLAVFPRLRPVSVALNTDGCGAWKPMNPDSSFPFEKENEFIETPQVA